MFNNKNKNKEREKKEEKKKPRIGPEKMFFRRQPRAGDGWWGNMLRATSGVPHITVSGSNNS